MSEDYFNDIQVIDDFLPYDEFVILRNFMLSGEFPWYYNSGKLSDIRNDSHYDYQFTHTFFKDNKQLSGYYDILTPILRNIRPYAIFRIKANLTMHYEKVLPYGFHTDIENTYKNIKLFKTAIFYLNDSDGKTLFKNGREVETVENRFVVFNCSLPHTATTHTSKTRCVLNFNYIH